MRFVYVSPPLPPHAHPSALLLAVLRGHQAEIGRTAWSPDGERLASASRDRTLRIWNPETAQCVTVIPTRWAMGSVTWSHDGALLACAAAGNVPQIWIYDAQTGAEVRSFKLDDVSWVTDVRWSPDGATLAAASAEGLITLFSTSSWRATPLDASGSAIDVIAWSRAGNLAAASRDGTVRIWDHASIAERASSDDEIAPLFSLGVTHRGPNMGLAWSPTGQFLATAGPTPVITILDLAQVAKVQELEGHTALISKLDFTASGDLLCSKSLDGHVALWRTDTWEPLASIEEPVADRQWWLHSCNTHPTEPHLATLGYEDREIRIWQLPSIDAHDASLSQPTVHYSNAKIVLVGDTGVGKSGLGKALAGERYQPTDSTHGRKIWLIASERIQQNDQPTDRETYLWDLAGQPGYRLVHQLHLTETAVAIVVFDSRGEVDPFAGVRHWALAVRQAERLNTLGYSIYKVLVAARGDRGGTPVGETRLKQLQEDYSFDGYLKTSAKDGWGIEDLKSHVLANIPWADLPKVSSTELFADIRRFLTHEREAGRVLTPEAELYRTFLDSTGRREIDARGEFATCIGRADSRGLIKRLSFGGLVLLQPELLDTYASALVNAAKEEPDGMGSISEERALRCEFPLSESERLPDSDIEKLLLIATIEDLLRHEIALREQGEDGAYLVFPTQFTREHPVLEESMSRRVVIDFEGPVQHVYATLVVRLAHSGVYFGVKMWDKAVTFRHSRGKAGLIIEELRDGRGTLSLLFADDASDEARAQLESFVLRHLRRRAVQESVVVRHVVRCLGCGWEVPPDLIARMQDVSVELFRCPVCASTTDVERAGAQRETSRGRIIAMDRVAERNTQRAAASVVLRGKETTNEHDVFLAHNSSDADVVESLYELLRQRGINPWLDRKAIPPGRWFQDVIQKAIPTVRSAAIVVGSRGLGKWELLELRAFISQCIERDIPVIPVLLPGVKTLPADLAFLKELNAVAFKSRIDEEEALDLFVWGITGEPPLHLA